MAELMIRGLGVRCPLHPALMPFATYLSMSANPRPLFAHDPFLRGDAYRGPLQFGVHG